MKAFRAFGAGFALVLIGGLCSRPDWVLGGPSQYLAILGWRHGYARHNWGMAWRPDF